MSEQTCIAFLWYFPLGEVHFETKSISINFRYSAYSRYYYILPVFLLTAIWNIPRFLELKTCYKLNNSEVSFCERENSTHIDCKLTYCATELRKNLSYCRDFILIANFLIMVFLPLFLLIVLNGHIYRVLVKSSRRKRKQSIIKKRTNSKRDRRITTILMMIVIVFGCCNVPRVFINTFEVRTQKYIIIFES